MSDYFCTVYVMYMYLTALDMTRNYYSYLISYIDGQRAFHLLNVGNLNGALETIFFSIKFAWNACEATHKIYIIVKSSGKNTYEITKFDTPEVFNNKLGK